MAYVFTLIQHKGGVGKTTLAVNLAYLLGRIGKKVLVIDLDDQMNATDHLYKGDSLKIDYSISGLLSNFKSANPNDFIISETHFDNVSLIAADKGIPQTESLIQRLPSPVEPLMRIIKKITNDFDFVIIDCPPRIETLAHNALGASNSFILPFFGQYSVQVLNSILDIMDSLDMVNPDLKILAPVFNMYRSQTTADNLLLDDLKNSFSNPPLSEKTIYNEPLILPTATAFVQSCMINSSVFDRLSNSASSKAIEETFLKLVDLIVDQAGSLK